MITQAIFKIEKSLKEKAMKKAQNKGLSFGVVLKLATKAFADGTINVGVLPKESFNQKTREELKK